MFPVTNSPLFFVTIIRIIFGILVYKIELDTDYGNYDRYLLLFCFFVTNQLTSKWV